MSSVLLLILGYFIFNILLMAYLARLDRKLSVDKCKSLGNAHDAFAILFFGFPVILICLVAFLIELFHLHLYDRISNRCYSLYLKFRGNNEPPKDKDK